MVTWCWRLIIYLKKKNSFVQQAFMLMITWTLQVNEALLEAHRKVVESRLQLEVCMLLIFRQYSCLIKFKSWLTAVLLLHV